MLTAEEKKGLEVDKDDQSNTDLDTSMNAFALQLTNVKSELK